MKLYVLTDGQSNQIEHSKTLEECHAEVEKVARAIPWDQLHRVTCYITEEHTTLDDILHNEYFVETKHDNARGYSIGANTGMERIDLTSIKRRQDPTSVPRHLTIQERRDKIKNKVKGYDPRKVRKILNDREMWQ